jgi:hypothetical protein
MRYKKSPRGQHGFSREGYGHSERDFEEKNRLKCVGMEEELVSVLYS